MEILERQGSHDLCALLKKGGCDVVKTEIDPLEQEVLLCRYETVIQVGSQSNNQP
jgi:hypothetical protein